MAGFVGSLIGGILPGIFAAQAATTLADPAPYRLTLHLASGVMVLAATLLILRIRPLPDEAEPQRDETGKPKRGTNWTRPLLVLIVVMTFIRLFQVAGSATVMVYFNVYMDRQLLVATIG